MSVNHSMRKHGGWFLIDALVAIGVIALLTTALATSMTKQRRAEDRLAASRESIRLAEQALVALQARQSAPVPPEGTTLDIAPADASAPAGWRWVTVRVTREGRTITLTGLAPGGGER
jgi:type II secretory pathway pseudopilin PulG